MASFHIKHIVLLFSNILKVYLEAVRSSHINHMLLKLYFYEFTKIDMYCLFPLKPYRISVHLIDIFKIFTTIAHIKYIFNITLFTINYIRIYYIRNENCDFETRDGSFRLISP